jgi:glucoamylase
MHFRNNYYFLASSANVCAKFQACHAWDNAQNGTLNGNLIQMAPDGAMEWAFTDIAPGETIQMPVYICAGHSMESAVVSLQKAKSRSASEWINTTADYWQQFLQSASPCPIDQPEIIELYERSLLTMKLMTDEQSGSIIAAPEFDERFSLCGGYAYCWGRDAAFITTALDKAGLSHLSTRFYEWTLTAQHKDGSWQQRHYHDGSLAPSWGLQIDEGASIIWGMFQHYEALPVEQKAGFLKLVWEAVKLGASFLASWIDDETGLPLPSIDLWEEREAEHTYSSAAVYGGLIAAAAFAELMQQSALSTNWRNAANRMSESIRTLCWNEANGIFYRGVKLTVTEREYQQATASGLPITSSTTSKGYAKYLLQYDSVIDVSLLGCSMPFAVIPPNHPQAVSTADAIQRELTVPGVGGIKRYENDPYIGGNPWILTTLWLAQYRASNKQFADARDLLDWAVAHQTPFGLLPEQIDRNTGETAWVVPLTWSHAMFILTVHLIAEGES